jgi:hypothetical protein
MALLAAFVFLLFCYSLVSRRLEQTIVTGPIVFAAAGMLVGSVTIAALGPAFVRDVFLPSWIRASRFGGLESRSSGRSQHVLPKGALVAMPLKADSLCSP